jgi:hypothetical protein
MVQWPPPLNMTISICTAGQWPPLLPLPPFLMRFIEALVNLGLRVAVSWTEDGKITIYVYSSRALELVFGDIQDAIQRHAPFPAEVSAIYYIEGGNIMIWDRFRWDDNATWANDPVQIYP